MKNQSDAELFLEKLSEQVSPQNHKNLYDFLFSDNWIATGKNCYFFQAMAGQKMQAIFFMNGACVSLIHPIENSDLAIYININKTVFYPNDSIYGNDDSIFTKKIESYSISVGKFNLTKTADDPINLAAVRGEIVILNTEAGETPEQIKRTGQYRQYKVMYENGYKKSWHYRPIQWLVDLMPKSDEQILQEKIIDRLEEIIRLAEFYITNPEFNRLTSRKAFNY